MQFSALFGNIGLILIVLEKFFPIPQLAYKMVGVFVILLFFTSVSLGRFMDKSYSLELENEWGIQRDPFAKEVRQKLKINPKHAVHKKQY